MHDVKALIEELEACVAELSGDATPGKDHRCQQFIERHGRKLLAAIRPVRVTEEAVGHIQLIQHLAENIRDRNFADQRMHILRAVDRLRVALAMPGVVEVKPLTDDEIMEVIKEVAPWKSEPALNDLLNYEKSPPMFPQATYDVPSYRAKNLVRAVEKRIRSALTGGE